VFVIDTWYEATRWWEVKKRVYDRVIKAHPGIVLPHWMRYSRDRNDHKRNCVVLEDGFFTEGGFGANDIVKQCKKALEMIGQENSLKLETL
jgi:hypothetical protein